MNLLSFFVAVLPVFLIGLYIYKKDVEKEPSILLFKLFMCGILSCIPAALIGLFLDNFFPEMEYMNFWQLIVYIFIVVAFVEELCKWFFVYKIAYNHIEFDYSYDIVVYAVFTSLGFACFENILYVSTTGFFTGIARAFLAVPGHACDGILMGLYLGLAKINSVKGNDKNTKKYIILSLLIPTITHGIYDFCLFTGSFLFVCIFVIFVITLDIICIMQVKKISKNSLRFRYKNNFCSVCGTLVNSNFCPRCGNKNI